ncbi:MAG TPA: LuxR C-terminal-related transcriptional regulator [Acidimicrobiales bacterium]|nr:LuxR C-terminal-related transcriptional regulator [Acidimicrobiales bacterium]
MGGLPELLTAPWPLTGRHEEVDGVCSAIEDGCPAFFVLGEAGTGKTRLAREVLRRLERDGWVTAGATATESAQATPLGAVAHLVPVDAVGAPHTLVQATREAIEDRTEGRPLVLHLDDAHHLDASSATLLVSLVEAGVVRLVITQRAGVGGPGALTALRAADHARSITLDTLDPVAVDTLLHRVLGAPLDGIAEAQILATSGGNPLFLRELVLGAMDDGTLHEVSGVWRLRGPLPAGRLLADRVLGRMATLPETAREVLELVAVAEPIGLDLLETLADHEVLEDLEGRGLIRVEASRRRHEVRLGHPVYGEILRSTIGRVRLRRLSRSLVEAVTARGARRAGDAARIVRWQIDAGLTPDGAVVLASARLARHAQDWPATAELSRAALNAGQPDAAALLVEALYALGEFREGDAVAQAAFADPGSLGEVALVDLHRARADSLFFGEGDTDAAVAGVADLRAQVSDPVQRQLLAFSEAAMLIWGGRVTQALALVDGLREVHDERVAVQAAMIAETAAAACGPARRAVALADAGFGRHLGLADLNGPTNPGFHLVVKTVALANAGRLAEAAELAEAGYGASVAERSMSGQMWFTLELGRIALLRGDAVSARRWYREQIALCRGTGWRRPITLGLSGLAVAEAALGNASEAAAAVAERDATGLRVIELFEIEGVRGTAWAAAAAGDNATARRVLVEGAEAAEANGLTLMAALARLDAVRLGARDQHAPLAAAAATVDSRLVELGARWAAAPDDGAELDAVSVAFQDLGCVLIAAEVAAAAGDAWQRAGENRRAAASRNRADELAGRGRGLATPALTVVESVVPLTAREREIVVMVAGGLATKEVAERLFISARTVSNHLQNAYAKLGVTKRSELAAALVRFGEAPAAPADGGALDDGVGGPGSVR